MAVVRQQFLGHIWDSQQTFRNLINFLQERCQKAILSKAKQSNFGKTALSSDKLFGMRCTNIIHGVCDKHWSHGIWLYTCTHANYHDVYKIYKLDIYKFQLTITIFEAHVRFLHHISISFESDLNLEQLKFIQTCVTIFHQISTIAITDNSLCE